MGEQVPFVQDDAFRRILPTWTAAAARQDRPVRVFVAGPPGSGKTAVADLVQEALDRRGGAVRISSDLYKSLHPQYAGFLADDVRTAGVRVRADIRRWQEQLAAQARARGYDVVIETALAEVEELRAAAAAARQDGARLELVAVAAPLALSQAGILDRFLDGAMEGSGGRYVSWDNHDTCAQRLLENLAVVEEEQLVGRVTVVRRDGAVLYDNSLTGGTWRRRPGAARAVVAERERPWTARETGQFLSGLARTERRVHTAGIPEDSRLAVQRDVARAAALAEPLRRIAQPTRRAPGVDYHRLSPAEHDWTFTELIVPGYLDDVLTQERPRVVYVMGQPGAGKTRAARGVLRELREQGRRPVRVVGERFKTRHPDYLELLQGEPRTAGARIRPDYTAWQERAEAWVRERSGDMVIEIAPGSAGRFLEGAARCRRAGYRVELVVLAVRAADSRQGTAARYAEVSRGGMPARFTSTAGHDRCFAAVTDALAAAEHDGAGPLVDLVQVVRRDGSVVHHNTRAPDGRWDRPADGVRMLVQERLRPYTQDEAKVFLDLHGELWSLLPRYRGELEETLQLARLLLPGARRLHAVGTPLAAVPEAEHAVPLAVGYCPVSSSKRAA
ncbi:zeta toxin family protein [Streptomyces candidus]|uniref:UDP-N-acetylglucosamine kinase n=1 Tax=Streptomyces candidus TaxID=67283 RepID=A0A7X0LSB6_9ACTN|nr:zeta toxin family protein [Streptomyces candidus]MBB6439032.1 adenylylsulfate kinase-like enzyme [Streptomyces candidus]GHH55395.1 ATP/GTP-binding protein [Streptomyces candidus]